MNKTAKQYMNSVIEVISDKYNIEKDKSYKLVKTSFLYNSLLNHLEETLHDDIETNADIIYGDYITKTTK